MNKFCELCWLNTVCAWCNEKLCLVCKSTKNKEYQDKLNAEAIERAEKIANWEIIPVNIGSISSSYCWVCWYPKTRCKCK